MSTDTITLDKQSLIAERLGSVAKPLRVNIGNKTVQVTPITEDFDDAWDLNKNGEVIMTEKNKKARKKAKEELEMGETVHIDFKKINNYTDFMHMIKSK